MKENKQPTNDLEQLPEIPVNEAWGEMNKLLNLSMPIVPSAARGSFVSKGVATAIKIMTVVGCAAAVVTGHHYYNAPINKTKAKEEIRTKHIAKSIHHNIDSTQATTTTDNQSINLTTPNNYIIEINKQNEKINTSTPTLANAVNNEAAGNSKETVVIKSEDKLPENKEQPSTLTGTKSRQKDKRNNKINQSKIAASDISNQRLSTKTAISNTQKAEKPIKDNIDEVKQPENNSESTINDKINIDAPTININIADSVVQIAPVLVNNVAPLTVSHATTMTSGDIHNTNRTGQNVNINNPLDNTAKTRIRRWSGLSGGLQNSFKIPIYGTSGYFVQTNGEKQTLMMLIPDIWLSKKISPNNSISLIVSPLVNLYTNNVVTYQNITINNNVNYNSYFIISKRKLVKVSGSGVSMLYKYEPDKHWQLSMGMGYNRINHALINATSELDTLHSIISSKYLGAKKDTLDWPYVKPNIITGRIEIGYSIKWFNIGTGVTIPLSPASRSNDGHSHPVNWDVYFRYTLFKRD